MKNTKRLLSLVLMLSVVLSCTCISLPAQSAAGRKAAAEPLPGETVIVNGVVADTLLDAAAYASANPSAAAQSTGTTAIADKLAAELEKRTGVQKIIDGIMTPLKVVKGVDSKEDLVLMLKKVLVESIGGLADGLIKTIIKIFPMRDFAHYNDYVPENFLKAQLPVKPPQPKMPDGAPDTRV